MSGRSNRISGRNNPHTAKDLAALEFFETGLRNIGSKADRIREYRRGVSRLASVANKRIERLERNNLTSTPAYQKFIEDGGERFGVKGKSYNEVQRELSRLRRFIEAKTSTVRGANNVLKEIASNTGIKYKNMAELKVKSAKFFELASKVEQYLRNVEDAASAIGYQKIWEAINTYTDAAKVDLTDTGLSVEDMLENVTNALTEYEEPSEFISGWYSLKDDDLEGGGKF